MFHRTMIFPSKSMGTLRSVRRLFYQGSLDGTTEIQNSSRMPSVLSLIDPLHNAGGGGTGKSV